MNKGKCVKNDPFGALRPIFSRDNGVDDFLQQQEAIDEFRKESELDKFKQGRCLRHNVLMSKNERTGNGLRQMMTRMSPDCRANYARLVFKKTVDELLALDDVVLGKEAKRVFDRLDLGYADGFVKRFLQGCLPHAPSTTPVQSQ